MIILGLHFGHDASVTLLKDGKIIFCIEKERVSRIRHVIGLNFSDIKLCLKKFNVKIIKDKLIFADLDNSLYL